MIWDDLPRNGGQVARGLARFLPSIVGEYEVLFQNWQLGVRKVGRISNPSCGA